MSIANDLKKIKCGKLLQNVDLSLYTTYKLKATASYVVIPSDIDDLLRVMNYIKKNDLKYKILGGGSNLIFDCDRYEGILIYLGKFDDVVIHDTQIHVGAGYPLMKLALKVSRLGLTGMEFATGIPGTIGGAVFNNAGAYGSDMGYIVESVTVLTPELRVKTLYNKDMEFHYRTSYFKTHPGYVCLDAKIILKPGDKEIIQTIIEDRKKRRLMTQPLEYPSAGSVFRNPPNLYAGELIENIGYKGRTIGGAKVSEKHANFIINYASATGKDIVTLIEEIQLKVKEKYDVDLFLEQEIVK